MSNILIHFDRWVWRALLIFALRTIGDKSEPRANRQLLYALTVEQPVP